jgi:hypothetical protein
MGVVGLLCFIVLHSTFSREMFIFTHVFDHHNALRMLWLRMRASIGKL